MKIDGMHCDMCAANLQRELKSVPGVKRVEVSFPEKSAVVQYEDKKVTCAILEQTAVSYTHLISTLPEKQCTTPRGRSLRKNSIVSPCASRSCTTTGNPNRLASII